MNYWLLKTEPETFSWDDIKSKKIAPWDGVRNYQARNFIKEMRVGDLCLFYHTGKEKAVVGIVKVVKEAYPDPSDETGKFLMMNVEFYKEIKRHITLEEIKLDDRFKDFYLCTHSRLSVMPVTKEQWGIIFSL